MVRRPDKVVLGSPPTLVARPDGPVRADVPAAATLGACKRLSMLCRFASRRAVSSARDDVAVDACEVSEAREVSAVSLIETSSSTAGNSTRALRSGSKSERVGRIRFVGALRVTAEAIGEEGASERDHIGGCAGLPVLVSLSAAGFSATTVCSDAVTTRSVVLMPSCLAGLGDGLSSCARDTKSRGLCGTGLFVRSGKPKVRPGVRCIGTDFCDPPEDAAAIAAGSGPVLEALRICRAGEDDLAGLLMTGPKTSSLLTAASRDSSLSTV